MKTSQSGVAPKLPLPGQFSGEIAQGLVPFQPIAQYELGTMRNFVYLVLDATSKEAAIVDPQKDIDTPLKDLEAAGYQLTACYLTHSHHDHVAGLAPLLTRFPHLPVYVNARDRFRLKGIPLSAFRELEDGQVFHLGSTEIVAYHTPGHSIGEISFLIKSGDGYLLSGDTLFIRDCGRTDFETGSNEEMFESLQKLKSLPDSVILLPGHHYAREVASRLGTEKQESPPLLCKNAEELKNLP